MRNKDIVHKLFESAAERFGAIGGGYTRITKIGFRKGDAAPISLVDFVGGDEFKKGKKGSWLSRVAGKGKTRVEPKKTDKPVEEPKAAKPEKEEAPPEKKEPMDSEPQKKESVEAVPVEAKKEEAVETEAKGQETPDAEEDAPEVKENAGDAESKL